MCLIARGHALHVWCGRSHRIGPTQHKESSVEWIRKVSVRDRLNGVARQESGGVGRPFCSCTDHVFVFWQVSLVELEALPEMGYDHVPSTKHGSPKVVVFVPSVAVGTHRQGIPGPSCLIAESGWSGCDLRPTSGGGEAGAPRRRIGAHHSL